MHRHNARGIPENAEAVKSVFSKYFSQILVNHLLMLYLMFSVIQVCVGKIIYQNKYKNIGELQ
jgi:hypothetical protein